MAADDQQEFFQSPSLPFMSIYCGYISMVAKLITLQISYCIET